MTKITNHIKITAAFLALIIALSCGAVCAAARVNAASQAYETAVNRGGEAPVAEPSHSTPDESASRREKCMEQYRHYVEDPDFFYYVELYQHIPQGSTEPDWIIVKAASGQEEPMPVTCVIGHRVLYSSSILLPFEFGYGIYDAARGNFRSLSQANTDDYEGLSEYMDEAAIGRPRGDADDDGELTVFDVTAVQRHLADIELLFYPQDAAAESADELYPLYLADSDGDGAVTIFDATRVQRCLAGMCRIDGTPV